MVLAGWHRQIASFRARILAIPSKVAAQVPAAARAIVADVVEREIYAALNEISGFREEEDGDRR